MSKPIVNSCNASEDRCWSVYFDEDEYETNYPVSNADSHFDKLVAKITSALVYKPTASSAIINTNAELAALKKTAPNPMYVWDSNHSTCAYTTYDANPEDPYNLDEDEENVGTYEEQCCNYAIETANESMMTLACDAQRKYYSWDEFFGQCYETLSIMNPMTFNDHFAYNNNEVL